MPQFQEIYRYIYERCSPAAQASESSPMADDEAAALLVYRASRRRRRAGWTSQHAIAARSATLLTGTRVLERRRVRATAHAEKNRDARGQARLQFVASSASAASTKTTDEPASECATTTKSGLGRRPREGLCVGERVEGREAREEPLRRRRVERFRWWRRRGLIY